MMTSPLAAKNFTRTDSSWLLVPLKPYYNTVKLKKAGTCVKQKEFIRRLGRALAQVARATGVSIGFLSALERGQMRSSIATLRRIARFYRTNILSLFETAGDNPRLVRP